MSQLEDISIQETPQQEDEKEIKNKRLSRFIREILSISSWIFVLIKIFVFDIDIFLLDRLSPNFVWLINYKFFILLAFLTAIFLFTKNKHILTWSLYIFFYPIIFIFWRIPSLIYKRKSWNLVFAIIDSIIALIQSFRLTFILTSLFLIFSLFIIVSNNHALLWVSIAILLIIHLWVYIQRMILVFKPSSVYQAYQKFFSFSGDFARRESLGSSSQLMLSDEELEIPLDQLNEKQVQKWISGVQMAALFNRVCLFAAKKVKTYQESKFNIISHVFGFFILFLATVFSFSLVNLGLFKINPNNFSFSSSPNFFNFFYYSFNNFLFNQIPELTAITPISQITSMVESFFALFLVAIFISLVLTFKNQRETIELDKVIQLLKSEGEKAEEYLKDKYKVNSITEAIEALKKLNVAIVEFLYKITESIDS